MEREIREARRALEAELRGVRTRLKDAEDDAEMLRGKLVLLEDEKVVATQYWKSMCESIEKDKERVQREAEAARNSWELKLEEECVQFETTWNSWKLKLEEERLQAEKVKRDEDKMERKKCLKEEADRRRHVCNAFEWEQKEIDPAMLKAVCGFWKSTQTQFIGEDGAKDLSLRYTRTSTAARLDMWLRITQHGFHGKSMARLERFFGKRKRSNVVRLARASDVDSKFNPTAVGYIRACEDNLQKNEVCNHNILHDFQLVHNFNMF